MAKGSLARRILKYIGVLVVAATGFTLYLSTSEGLHETTEGIAVQGRENPLKAARYLEETVTDDGLTGLELALKGPTSCKGLCNADLIGLLENGTRCRCTAEWCAITSSPGPCCSGYDEHCKGNIPPTPDIQLTWQPDPKRLTDHLDFPPMSYGSTPVYLDVVTILREPLIAKNDLQFGVRELIEWVEWLRFGGVAHFYIYDTSGSLGDHKELEAYVKEGYVTVIGWAMQSNPWTVHSRLDAYTDATSRFGGRTRWRAHLSPDAYPVAPNLAAGFICRALATQASDVGLMYMESYMFGGKTEGTSDVPRFMRNVWRSPSPAKDNDYYISRMDMANGFGSHRAGSFGKSVSGAKHVGLRVNVYRGQVIGLNADEMVKDEHVLEARSELDKLRVACTLFPGIPSALLGARLIRK